MRRPTLAVLVVALALALVGCAGQGPSVKTNPVGAVAYHADHVTQVMGTIERTIMAAADAVPPLLPVSAAKAALLSCRAVDEKAEELADALAALDELGLDQLKQKAALDKVLTILDAMTITLGQVQIPIGSQEVRAQVAALLSQVALVIRNVLLNLPRLPATEPWRAELLGRVS